MKELKGYRHGINLGGWFSQCDHSLKRYDQFIQKDDFSRIRRLGFDHVRIPIDYELILNKDCSFKEDGMKRIENCIRWSKDNGLNMILDLHKTVGFSFDDGEKESGFFENEDLQQIFYEIWRELAKRFGKEGNLSFELLNEVSEKRFCKTWNQIVRKAIEAIRIYVPDIKILVGGYYNNSIEAIKDLDEPYDENIVYNFHCYSPLIFTHQGAYWIKGMDEDFRMPFESSYETYRTNGRKYIDKEYEDAFPETDDLIDASYFKDLFKEAVQIAEQRGVALYCGEYGVIDRADPNETLKWYKCISEAFEMYHIGRSLWSYKEMDFGFVDAHYDMIRADLLELI